MTKEQLAEILNYSIENNITEKVSAEHFGFKEDSIYYYKKKYNLWKPKKIMNPDKETLLMLLEYCKKNKIKEKDAKKDFNIASGCNLYSFKIKYGIGLEEKYTKEQIENIIFYCKEKSITYKESCLHFGIPYSDFYKLKKKYNIKISSSYDRRKNSVNDNFFKDVNILNSYYGGFLAADGNITVRKGNLICRVGLSRKDKKWLIKFAEDINFSGEIHDYEEHGKETSLLLFSSKQIVEDLKRNFNITPAKSLTLEPPNIADKDLIDAFICGYIDGDGTIVMAKNRNNRQKRMIISMVGTYNMCLWIKKRFSEIIGKEIGSIQSNNGSDKIFSYTIGDSNARKIFIKYYNIIVPKLERKWSKEKYGYCINFRKRLEYRTCKGMNVFDSDCNLIREFKTLREASYFTGVKESYISQLSKEKKLCNGFYFSRNKTI